MYAGNTTPIAALFSYLNTVREFDMPQIRDIISL